MKLIKYILIVFTCFAFLSCNKDLLDNSSFELSKPILTDSGVVINWAIPKINNFRYYEILRSIDGKSFQTIKTDSTSINSTQYLDIAYPLGGNVTYRIALFANNIYVSNNVNINIPKPIELNFDPSNAYIMPELGKMLFFKGGWNDAYAYLFDYKNNSILKQINLPIKTTGYAFGFGKFKDNYEFYFNDGWDFKMQVYDALSFQPSTSVNFSTSYTHVFSVSDRYIFYYDFDHIRIIDREILAISDYWSVNNFFNKLYYINSQNKLIGFTSDQIVLMTLGNTGNVLGESIKKYQNSTAYDYIEGTNYIYGGYYDWKIINIQNWEENVLLDENSKEINFSLFHYSNNIIYAYSNTKKEMYCYSTDNLKLLKVIPTRVDPRILLSDDNYLYLLQSNFSGSTIIDKIKLIK